MFMKWESVKPEAKLNKAVRQLHETRCQFHAGVIDISEPDQTHFASAIDVAHECNLAASLYHVGLADTDLIYPENPLPEWNSKPLECTI
jgi:hypothetical protein